MTGTQTPPAPHRGALTASWIGRRGRPLLLGAVALVLLAAGLLVATRLTHSSTQPVPLRLTRVVQVSLPGQASRFEYADADASAHALFVAHMSDSTLLKVDTRSYRVLATASGLPGVTGVIAVPALHRVYASVTGDGQVATLDENTLRVMARSPAHGLLVAVGRAFVACDDNNLLVTLSLPALRPLGRLRVGAGPDVLAVDPARHLLYVAAESGVVTTIDISPAAGRVTGRAYLADNAHVVAVDPSTGRAYFPIRDAGHGHPGLIVTVPNP